MSPTVQNKQQMRQQLLALLRALPAERVREGSARLREKLLPLLAGARHICLYAPLAHEVDLLPLLHEAPEFCYYFPRCLPGRRLSFHRVRDAAAELEPGAWGIRAPLESLPTIEPAAVDAVVVPGVAFTLSGKRLGYGGGYYDRYLPLLQPSARTMALALPEQVVGDIPVEAYDVRVQHVLCCE